MTKIRIILFAAVLLTLTNCSSEKHQFPTDKRYWNTQDYSEAVMELNYGYESDEKLPAFNDPQTRIIVEKLTDPKNYTVVLDDNELGINHRSEVGETFFQRWNDMQNIYRATDRKDNYIYDQEMIAVWEFGLGLQLRYFELGNERISERADDPSSGRVERNINSNVNTLISNYVIYLDIINEEDALTAEGKTRFSTGIDKYFTKLVEAYPDANYSGMKRKVELMEKKSNSKEIKNSLMKLKKLIESEKTQEEKAPKHIT